MGSQTMDNEPFSNNGQMLNLTMDNQKMDNEPLPTIGSETIDNEA